MSKLLLTFLLAAGAIAPCQAQQVQAQQARAPQVQVLGQDPLSDAILVQGIREPRKEIGRFVDALTDAPFLGQLSRFDWAVCPAAVGLVEAQNAKIARRLREVAKAAAIPVARPGCKPNVLLIVTGDKRGLIGQLRRKYPAYFEGVSFSEIERMMRDSSPVAAWHVEGRLDADGIAVKRDVITGQEIIERTDAPSRLSTASRPHFIASIVVVDTHSLAGLTATQLADYAAMRAFARTDPRRLGTSIAPTILSVIEAPMNSSVPPTLTEWDLAFLKSLYASDPNVRASRQRGEMKQIVRRTVQGERKGDE